jgi:thioredoxin
MTTIDLTLETFESTIDFNDILFVDFWADWCGPCRMFSPIFERASETHTDIVFAKVDTEAQQQLAGMLAITSIPTLMVFREQVLIFSQPGSLPAQALEDLIAAVRNLDMNEVHEQIRKQQAQSVGPETASN